jgi:SAM-dependent methyltransferase
MTKENKNFFEEDSYLKIKYSEKRAPKSNYPIKLAEYLSSNFYKTKGTLLDIGCGTGDMLNAFSSIGFNCYGTDISQSCEKFCNGIPFQAVDLLKDDLPYKSNSIDFIFSKSVIEHLSDPVRLFKESYRVLKPGGVSIIMCPSWVHTNWGPFYVDYSHISPFTKPSLKDVMEMNEFKDVHVYHFYQLPHTWKLPFMKIFCKLISKFPIPYKPFYNDSLFVWPDSINKYIRFSNEVMLLAVGKK